MVLWLLRFDVNQRLDDAKALIANCKAKQAERRARQEQQENLWDPSQEAGSKRSAAFYKQQAAAKAMFDHQANVQAAPVQEAEPMATAVSGSL
jgi:vacuolar-type H+-ATPase subunit H